MSEIDLGVSFEDVKELDKFPVLPDGTYQFIVEKIDETKTGPNSKSPGRPMLKWQLAVNHPETGMKQSLFYQSVLPWIPPGQTEIDVSGVGMLVSICKGVGLPWAGQKFNPTNYIGRGGTVKVSQRNKQTLDPSLGKYVDDPSGDKVNNIDGFAY